MCEVSDCVARVFRNGLCGGHYKRVQRRRVHGAPLGGEQLSPEEQVIVAGSAYLEASASDEQSFRYRRRVFLRSAQNWLRALGWRPPKRGGRRA